MLDSTEDREEAPLPLCELFEKKRKKAVRRKKKIKQGAALIQALTNWPALLPSTLSSSSFLVLFVCLIVSFFSMPKIFPRQTNGDGKK